MATIDLYGESSKAINEGIAKKGHSAIFQTLLSSYHQRPKYWPLFSFIKNLTKKHSLDKNTISSSNLNWRFTLTIQAFARLKWIVKIKRIKAIPYLAQQEDNISGAWLTQNNRRKTSSHINMFIFSPEHMILCHRLGKNPSLFYFINKKKGLRINKLRIMHQSLFELTA